MVGGLPFACSSPVIPLFLDILHGIEEYQRVTIYSVAVALEDTLSCQQLRRT